MSIKTIIKPTVRHDIKIPSKYHVIYINDDKTTMEFVVESLMSVFGHSPETAETITMDVHEKGQAVAGTYTFEIAEQKGIEVTTMARGQGYPLQVKVEEE